MIIEIKGAIVTNDEKWVYDFFDIESTSPKDVISKLREANGQDVEVSINSGGGNVYAGIEIYTALKEYKGDTVGKIVGIAASAASIIGMGVKKLKISPAGQIMIHNASVQTSGDHIAMEHISDVLIQHDEGIANAYVLKTGIEKKKILKMMEQETYMNAQEALKLGFVDEILFDEGLKLSASIPQSEIPQAIIKKLRNLKASNEGAFLMPKNQAKEIVPQCEQNEDEDRAEETTEPVSHRASEQDEYVNTLKLKIMGGIANV